MNAYTTEAIPSLREQLISAPSLVKDRLRELSCNAPVSIREPMSVHLNNAGKGLRATLAYGACRNLGLTHEIGLSWAVAVELVHNASLVHDDVCDKDAFRRGKESIYRKYGDAVAICLGDYLLGQAFSLAATLSAEAVIVLSKNIARLSAGQASEFMCAGYPDWHYYTGIATNKTSPALLMAVEGAIAMAGHNNDIALLNRYFDNASICFQIINDIKNFSGLDGAANPCSDLANCRPNAVIACFKTLLPHDEAARFDIWADRIRSGDLIADTTETRYWWQRVKNSKAFIHVEDQLRIAFDQATTSLTNTSPHIAEPLQPFHQWIAAEISASSLCS